MVCQSETIRLLQEILNKLGPPQAKTARYATRQPIGCQPSADVIPAPSAPLTDSALFVHPAPSAGRKELFQVFYEPLPPSEFNGDCSARMTFWASCRSCIRYDPEIFPDDATKIYWVMSHMTTGRASRWAARELDREARNGCFRFPDWSAFLEEFRRDFLPLHFEAITVNPLETMAYYQGKQSVGEYLDEFLNLVEDSRCTDLRTVVVKFRRGLDRRISTAPARPSFVDPDAWFSFAIQTEQDLTSETTPSTPVPADEAIRTSAPSEEACCAPAAVDLPTPTFATEILPPPIEEAPHLPAPAKETPCTSAPSEAACRTSAPAEEVSCTSSSADAAHCSPVPADLAVPVALPSPSVGVAEPPSEAANPRGTVGCYPEGCPTRSDVRYVDENNPETEVEDAPAENAAPAKSPVPRAIPPAVTGLPASEEELPLSVDPPALQTSSPVPLPLCNDRLAVCGTPEPDVGKDIQESQPPRLNWPSTREAPRLGVNKSAREARVLAPRPPTEPRKLMRPEWARRLRPRKPGTPVSIQCLPGEGVILLTPLSHF